MAWESHRDSALPCWGKHIRPPLSVLAESTVSGFERLRADVMWRPVIAALDEHAWMSTDNKYAEQFDQELATLAGKGRYKVLPTALVRRLQACFSTLVGSGLCLDACQECSSLAMCCRVYREQCPCVAKHRW